MHLSGFRILRIICTVEAHSSELLVYARLVDSIVKSVSESLMILVGFDVWIRIGVWCFSGGRCV